ncbi:hypothetical protein Cantr_01950 [Candida viswanathii]|uniref:Major facilitator superfamily (MFS) profile domain-containing protein n=1 Tax=Candida viswanathii TaxID=5486 RepID=A0A367YKP2_9ASCO|nr:hypothetical protein Cantr_01950 [Candida viswanathii]
MSDLVNIQEEMVPGTVHLVDIRGNLNVKKHGDIILQPQPTSNPNDPLTWSRWKRVSQFAIVWVWGFFVAIAINWTGPLYGVWEEQLGVTLGQLGISVALGFLFLGVGVLVIQPTALKIGKRIVYICGTIICIVSLAVGSQATSIDSIYAFKVLVGFSASPCDSLVELSATDLFFQHERSTVIALLVLALYAGSFIGPVVAGYVVDTIGWIWCFYIQIIIYLAFFLVQLFFMEETTFRRHLDGEDLEEDIIKQIKSSELVPPKEATTDIKGALEKVTYDEELDMSGSVSKIPKQSYLKRMRLIHTDQNDVRSWLCIFYRPFFVCYFPAFVFGGIVYGSQMMWLLLVANTQLLVYGSEPYNFSAGSVGLTNLGSLAGSVLGTFYGGNFVDWLSIKLAKRNNGILEPEFRLWAMIVPTIVNACGLLAYWLPCASGKSWAYSVVLGQGALGFAMSSSGSICITYAVDSYPKLASEGIVLMLFIRNMIGMGFSFAILPWINTSGLTVTTWLMFMLSVVINGSFIGMLIFGKRIRRWTAHSYEKISNPSYGELFKR